MWTYLDKLFLYLLLAHHARHLRSEMPNDVSMNLPIQYIQMRENRNNGDVSCWHIFGMSLIGPACIAAISQL